MEMKISFPGNLKVDAEYNGFTIQTDQPLGGGGDGTAPAPFDMFLASLGTCAGIYVVAFLRQRGFDPSEAGITMTTEYDMDKGLIGRIAFNVDLPEGFPEKYEAAIIRAVDQCAVKRHMVDPPEFAVTTSRRVAV